MSRSVFASRFAALGVVAAAALAGCTGDEVVAPVDGAGGSSSASSTSASSGSSSSASQSSSSTGGGPVLRTVLSRNPFGDQAGNLLADGDFDLSFGFAGQQGWTAYTNQQITLVAETGGLCKSGLRCARVPPGAALFGRGTSAADGQEMRATIWAKPTTEGAACDGISAQVLGCDSFFPRGTLTRAVGGDDDDGWCAFTASVTGSKIATCLYVENNSDQAFLLDAATMVAVDPTEAPRPAPLPASLERTARMERVRDLVRDTLPFGSPPATPPRPGQRAHGRAD